MATAPTLKLDLSNATASGYFTIASGASTEVGYKETTDTIASGSSKIATASVGDTTSVLKGLSNAVSVGGTSTATWRITTGSNADIIDASNLGSDTTILAGAGDNSITGGVGTFITTGGGADSIIAGKDNYISSGSGNDSIEIGSSATYVTVDAGLGSDSIAVGGAYAQVNLGNTGSSSGKNEVSIGAGGTDATIVGGAGVDSIQVGGKGATITLGKGKDIVSVGADTTITDYTLADDVIQTANVEVAAAANLVASVTGGAFGTDGGLKLSSSATLTVNATNGYYGVGIDSTGTALVADEDIFWAGESASTIKASSTSSSAKVVIVSANNSDVGDSVTGTSLADTIVAGSNDTINGGAGADSIYIVDGSENVTVELATVSSATTDTVTGTNVAYGFEDTDLTVAIAGKMSAAKFSGDANGLSLTSGKATVSLAGATAVEDGIYAAGEGALLKVKDSTGTTYNVEAIEESETATLASAVTYIYGGDGAALAITDDQQGDTVTIDLRNDSTQFGDTRTYSGITSVTADGYTGNALIVGSSKVANSLVGGAEGGHVSLYGGGSKADTLVGGESQDIFFYGKGDGRDIIENYTYDEDDTKTDKIGFWTGDLPTTIKRTSDTSVELTIGSGTSNRLTVNTVGDTDTAIAYTLNGETYKFKAAQYDTASTLTYDSTVGFYQGGKGSDTLLVNSESDVVVALDGSQSGYNYASIEAIDASNSTGAVTLRGGSASETFTGAIGGNTTYEFGKNGGHDTITGTSATDRIYLYDVKGLEGELTSYAVDSNNTLTLKLSDGSRLDVQNFTDGTVLATSDNTSGWVYDSSTSTWSLVEA